MSNEKVKDTLAGSIIEKVDVPAGLTNEQVLRMLLKTQEDLAESQKQLASAILESRKPYVDPKVLEQKARDNAERQRLIQAEQAEKIARKKVCPHIRDNGTPNIKWMEHSNSIIMGVCGTCRSEFDTRIAADLELLRKDLKSIKNMGRAGPHARRDASPTSSFA